MHSYIHSCISSLPYLLSHDVVIKRILRRENYDFLLLNLFYFLRLSFLWAIFNRPIWNSSCICTRRSLLWTSSAFCFGCLIVCWLPSLNYSSLDISVSSIGIRNRLVIIDCCWVDNIWLLWRASRWANYSPFFRRTWLEEEIVNDHLSLVHVHWRRSSNNHCSWRWRLFSLEHLTLLLF